MTSVRNSARSDGLLSSRHYGAHIHQTIQTEYLSLSYAAEKAWKLLNGFAVEHTCFRQYYGFRVNFRTAASVRPKMVRKLSMPLEYPSIPIQVT